MPIQTISPQKILDTFYDYVRINSETGTLKENKASDFVFGYFSRLAYFKTHPDRFGRLALPGDPFGRAVVWALVKGRGRKTAVLMHHFDVVGIEDFLRFKDHAFEPDALMRELKKSPDVLSPEARKDLMSGEWIFGRGTADMKAGGAIQMAMIEAYGELENFEGNLLMIAVPDEENMSAGMRGALPLLDALHERHGIDYALMINSEPHQRRSADRGLFSGGSIGKIMPFFYSRGILAHAGKSSEGFNPLLILSECIRRTEMNLDLADVNAAAGEMSPLPTWLMARDGKTAYDVSMPLSAFGCLSMQPLSSSPSDILAGLKSLATKGAMKAVDRVNSGSGLYDEKTGRKSKAKKWQTRVHLFGEWLKMMTERHGQPFETFYAKTLKGVHDRVESGTVTYGQGTWMLMDELFEYAGCEEPTLIIGIVPPFYPGVSYLDREDFKKTISDLHQALNSAAHSHHDRAYDLEAYFTGISDLSYTSVKPQDLLAFQVTIPHEMPLYGGPYTIPFELIAKHAMPCINIGPWGKDFHKLSERVLKEDLLRCTPHLIQCALKHILKQ
ncbi:MAG: M20/M25/M40 family metallo-hydrolase [Desulfobacula sp.]|jgi:arginine utilization protein RocB